MLDRAGFRRQLAKHLEYIGDRSPLASSMLRAIDADLGSGAPWFERLARAWSGRDFGPHYEAPGLLLAGIHREALAGKFRLDDGDAAGAFLRDAAQGFFEDLAGERLQGNQPPRAVAWLLPACAGFMPRGTPFHLVELGTSAGLLLVGDYLPRTMKLLTAEGAPAEEPPRWRDAPYPVLSRHGLDVRPRRVQDPADLLWLKACVWPDDVERMKRLEEAARLFASLAREKTGPRLHERSFAGMPAWLAENLRPHAEEGLLVFNAQAADFLPQAGYDALKDGVAKALEPWGDRGLWVELEYPRSGGDEHELRAHRWVRGAFETRSLARGDGRAGGLRVLPGWDFLAPLSPIHPPRITREEPPKQLQPGRYRFPGGSS
ncbi:MAG: DUF2332 family protein [Elusimicrobia bacterium]|nr:DUF2332 family protein [Elusimicrobiota bacterium]